MPSGSWEGNQMSASRKIDLVLRDEHLDQRDAELRPFVADGDVVGVDVSQVVIFVHACGGEHAGQEQEDKFSYRLGV